MMKIEVRRDFARDWRHARKAVAMRAVWALDAFFAAQFAGAAAKNKSASGALVLVSWRVAADGGVVLLSAPLKADVGSKRAVHHAFMGGMVFGYFRLSMFEFTGPARLLAQGRWNDGLAHSARYAWH